ncbi:MAG: hypothetical protein M9936_00800 [Caldilinea sp.]|nr:hypothetical protein [Caldilineaceae bacterium]MCO5208202.1 hypothetical protein [Caldilinea sp.]
MLIVITTTLLLALGSGAFVMLFAATALTKRTLAMDPSFDEQPLKHWGLNASARTLPTHININ